MSQDGIGLARRRRDKQEDDAKDNCPGSEELDKPQVTFRHMRGFVDIVKSRARIRAKTLDALV
jgi:hypothetical protein